MAKYPKNHLEIPQVPLAVLAMDTIGHLPFTSRGHQWVLTAINMHMSYVFAIPMKEKSAENVVQVYLYGIFTHKGGSMAILSESGTEFKNTVLDNACKQFGIKILLSAWCWGELQPDSPTYTRLSNLLYTAEPCT